MGDANTSAPTNSLPRWFVTLVIGRRPAWTLARLAALILGAWLVFHYVLTPPIRVTGISMLPTYHDGQINFLYRLAYFRSDPQRGDVVGVGFKGTSGNDFMLLKRIIGLPGETIAFVHGKLHINGEPVDEPYVKTPWNWNMHPRQLGPDEYYVVGDNRSMDFADHTQGIASRRQIVGRTLFRSSS